MPLPLSGTQFSLHASKENVLTTAHMLYFYLMCLSTEHWLMLTFLGGPPLPNPCNGSKWEGHVLFICDQNEYAVSISSLPSGIPAWVRAT